MTTTEQNTNIKFKPSNLPLKHKRIYRRLVSYINSQSYFELQDEHPWETNSKFKDWPNPAYSYYYSVENRQEFYAMYLADKTLDFWRTYGMPQSYSKKQSQEAMETIISDILVSNDTDTDTDDDKG